MTAVGRGRHLGGDSGKQVNEHLHWPESESRDYGKEFSRDRRRFPCQEHIWERYTPGERAVIIAEQRRQSERSGIGGDNQWTSAKLKTVTERSVSPVICKSGTRWIDWMSFPPPGWERGDAP